MLVSRRATRSINVPLLARRQAYGSHDRAKQSRLTTPQTCTGGRSTGRRTALSIGPATDSSRIRPDLRSQAATHAAKRHSGDNEHVRRRFATGNRTVVGDPDQLLAIGCAIWASARCLEWTEAQDRDSVLYVVRPTYGSGGFPCG